MNECKLVSFFIFGIFIKYCIFANRKMRKIVCFSCKKKRQNTKSIGFIILRWPKKWNQKWWEKSGKTKRRIRARARAFELLIYNYRFQPENCLQGKRNRQKTKSKERDENEQKYWSLWAYKFAFVINFIIDSKPKIKKTKTWIEEGNQWIIQLVKQL